MRHRVYNIQCLENCEFLVVPLNDLDRMKKEHASIAKRFFKR
jgi:hypothetical protein